MEGAEFLDDEHPDVQAFVGNDAATREDFSRLDADFVRVIEDGRVKPPCRPS